MSNDFVIRNGFPALRKPGGKEPWIEGDEPIPPHKAWLDAFEELPSTLIDDCRAVFTARTRDDHAAYSHGVTYFLPKTMKPRCGLESVVQSIFDRHTQHLADGVMIPEQSGAEWWTLAMEEDGEVGWHFDADYGLEDQAPNLLIHPRVATVTYLTESGPPTVVLDRVSPPPTDIESLAGPVPRAWMSHPKLGRHLAFDGRLLHGAPSELMGDEEPTKKKAKLEPRVTLLVNVWVNHCPLDAEPLDDYIVASLTSPVESSLSWKPQTESFSKVQLSVTEDSVEDEVVICHRSVTVSVSTIPRADLAEIEVIEEGALTIEVGGIVESDDEEGDEDDDSDDGAEGEEGTDEGGGEDEGDDT